MSYCLGTLENLNMVKNNGIYSEKFSLMMFGIKSPVTLEITRKEFKQSAPKFVKGMSILLNQIHQAQSGLTKSKFNRVV